MNSSEISNNELQEIRFKDCIVYWKYQRTTDIQRTILLNVFDYEGDYRPLKTFISIRGGLKKIKIIEIHPYNHDHSMVKSDAITADELENILETCSQNQ